jgi:hypothetical protein
LNLEFCTDAWWAVTYDRSPGIRALFKEAIRELFHAPKTFKGHLLVVPSPDALESLVEGEEASVQESRRGIAWFGPPLGADLSSTAVIPIAVNQDAWKRMKGNSSENCERSGEWIDFATKGHNPYSMVCKTCRHFRPKSCGYQHQFLGSHGLRAYEPFMFSRDEPRAARLVVIDNDANYHIATQSVAIKDIEVLASRGDLAKFLNRIITVANSLPDKETCEGGELLERLAYPSSLVEWLDELKAFDVPSFKVEDFVEEIDDDRLLHDPQRLVSQVLRTIREYIAGEPVMIGIAPKVQSVNDRRFYVKGRFPADKYAASRVVLLYDGAGESMWLEQLAEHLTVVSPIDLLPARPRERAMRLVKIVAHFFEHDDWMGQSDLGGVAGCDRTTIQRDWDQLVQSVPLETAKAGNKVVARAAWHGQAMSAST